MDTSHLDLNALTAFVAVVEHRSFRGAARSLAVPKSTVSRRISLLEKQLGVQLLQRTTRTVTLTDVGEAFHQRCSQALVAINDAAREVLLSETAPRGVLRMTAPITFAEHFLSNIVSEFLVAHPEVRVTLDLTDRYVDLVGEGYDLALRAGTLSDSTLKVRLLGTNRLAMVASPDYLERHGRPKSPQELVDHDCIVYANTERAARWPFLIRRKSVMQPVRPRVAVNSFLLARDFAAAGLGIARIPSGYTVDLEEQGRLEPVLADFEPPPSPLHAVFPPGQHLPPKVRAFVDLLASRLDTSRAFPPPKRRAPARPE